MRIGTRRSALALAQAELVATALGGAEIVPISTRGDRQSAGLLSADHTDKSRWVGELEQALQEGLIDLAVHSAKDVPGELAEGLELLGCPPRAGAEDVLCGARGLSALAPRARIGTSSLRRLAQLRCARADLEVIPIRGNVDTRLAKLAAGELDAIVLARAGLQRLGRDQEAGATLDARVFVPAPGQGALALQGRSDDGRARSAVAAICDRATLCALSAERALALELAADCDTPLGAYAEVDAQAGTMSLRAWVGVPDGSAWACDEQQGAAEDPRALARTVAQRLRAVGAQELLDQARLEVARER